MGLGHQLLIWLTDRWLGVRYSHDFILNVKNANWQDLVEDQQREECNPALQLQVQQPECCFHSIPLWTFMGWGSKPVVILEAVILKYNKLHWSWMSMLNLTVLLRVGWFYCLTVLSKAIPPWSHMSSAKRKGSFVLPYVCVYPQVTACGREGRIPQGAAGISAHSGQLNSDDVWVVGLER